MKAADVHLGPIVLLLFGIAERLDISPFLLWMAVITLVLGIVVERLHPEQPTPPQRITVHVSGALDAQEVAAAIKQALRRTRRPS